MGLLDPQNIPELGVIMGLLSGRDPNWSMKMQQMAFQQAQEKNRAQEMKMRQEQHGLSQQTTQLQLDQLRKQQGVQDQLRGAATQAFAPPQEAHGPMESGQGAPMLPGGGGMPDFVRQAMQIDPLEGMKYQQAMAKESPFGKVDLDKFTPESIQKFVASGGRDYTQLRPREKVEVTNGVAFNPYSTKPGDFVTGPQSDVVPDGKGGWMPNPSKVALRSAGAPKMTVDNRLENKEHAEMGALNIKGYGDLKSAAASARKENALLTGIERLNLDTNKLTPANSTVSAWVAALGGGERFKNVAAQGEGFTAFTKELVLTRLAAQKGPQTDQDAQRAEETVTRLGNTTQANKFLVAFNKAINNRSIAQEKFYSDWWDKKKTLAGADTAWFSSEGGQSIWDSDPGLKKFQGPSAGGGRVIDFNQLPSSNGR